MLKIDILRHGQTDSNTQGRYLGSTDAPLNDKGIAQAHRAAERLKSIRYDAIYASPLKRAWQTAEIVAEPHGLEVRRLDGIAERNFGIFDNLTYREIGERYPEEQAAWEQNINEYIPPEGESALQVRERVARTLDSLKIQHADGSILLVTHLGLTRQLVAHLLDMPVEAGWHFMLDNTAVASIEINNGFGVLTSLG